MYGWVIVLLVFLCFYTILQGVTKLLQQRKHLEDDTLRKVVDTSIRYEKNYDAAIGHLGICEKCQKRLEEISKE